MHAPESIVAVGDSSLVLSTIGKCLDEERVFDIPSFARILPHFDFNIDEKTVRRKWKYPRSNCSD